MPAKICRVRSEVDFEAQQFVRVRHSRQLSRRYRSSTLAKSSIVIFPSCTVAAGFGLRVALPGVIADRCGLFSAAAVAAGRPCSSIFCILSIADLSARGNTALISPSFVPTKLSPLETCQINLLDVVPVPVATRFSRWTPESPDAPAQSRCAMPQRWCTAR